MDDNVRSALSLIDLLNPSKGHTDLLLQAPELVRNKSVLSSVLSHGTEPGVKVVQGVRIEDLVVGTGRRAESGRKVKVHYVGKFQNNGRVFDASKNRPFQFRLGRSEVIQGCVCVSKSVEVVPLNNCDNFSLFR